MKHEPQRILRKHAAWQRDIGALTHVELGRRHAYLHGFRADRLREYATLGQTRLTELRGDPDAWTCLQVNGLAQGFVFCGLNERMAERTVERRLGPMWLPVARPGRVRLKAARDELRRLTDMATQALPWKSAGPVTHQFAEAQALEQRPDLARTIRAAEHGTAYSEAWIAGELVALVDHALGRVDPQVMRRIDREVLRRARALGGDERARHELEEEKRREEHRPANRRGAYKVNEQLAAQRAERLQDAQERYKELRRVDGYSRSETVTLLHGEHQRFKQRCNFTGWLGVAGLEAELKNDRSDKVVQTV